MVKKPHVDLSVNLMKPSEDRCDITLHCRRVPEDSSDVKTFTETTGEVEDTEPGNDCQTPVPSLPFGTTHLPHPTGRIVQAVSIRAILLVRYLLYLATTKFYPRRLPLPR